MAYVKTQLTELLTNYGPIPILVIDGWSWQMGHNAVAYQEIRALVKSLQPNCLLTDHTHLADPYDVDIVNFEEPRGGWAPANNRYPAQQEQKINGSGGNDWFWAPDLGKLMTVPDVVTRHLADLEPKWTNFLLNCPPDREGRLPPAVVALLREVGAAWAPNPTRSRLPAQLPQNERPYTPRSATATSGEAAHAIDGKNDAEYITMWRPAGPLPQSITMDLGPADPVPELGWLGCVPHYHLEKSSREGNVTSYRILTSGDGRNFNQVGAGNWAADGKMQVATFAPVRARFVRFEILAANGNPAVTEIAVGGPSGSVVQGRP
jgi:alpha-L-fucosidase